ncbi:hypothetical protein LHK94_20545 [Dickeya zeae]|uniref:hypothetical protein n=1 Tax=Dickeya zeae TaxID=204042 RepID=UPI001CF9A362|nr:hypothetical protein [Dickeya zeae]UCZ75345.1 hypothetical protein LHK94_20545 [Dickeya zeae]
MEDESTFRIKFAFYHSNWEFDRDSVPELKANGKRVLPSEFTIEMRHHIFCPECATPLSRRPQNKDKATDGRNPSFAHLPSYSNIYCSLRVKTAKGRQYNSEEEAKKAIANDQLAIVESFMKERPELPEGNNGVYDQNHIEDQDGEISEVPIGRHRGQSFKLPSTITSVAGMCRNFDQNYYKYYMLPGEKNAERLDRLLTNINNVQSTTDAPKLYYAKILSSFSKPWDHSVRMTRLAWNSAGKYKDFYFKQNNKDSLGHGVNEDSRGRILLMYGVVTVNGVGLCIAHVGWGEFALLPEKYNYLFED